MWDKACALPCRQIVLLLQLVATLICPDTLKGNRGGTRNLNGIETTVGKGWVLGVLVGCLSTGLVLTGFLQTAMAAEREQGLSPQRVNRSSVNQWKSPVHRVSNRGSAKRGGKSFRSSRKKQTRVNHAKLKRENTTTQQKGPLSGGKNQIVHDLSTHGVLERPQRYDPGKPLSHGAVPNPKARELRADHFQELDKNYDGVLDPLERATSRLDIDRDLSNRRWK